MLLKEKKTLFVALFILISVGVGIFFLWRGFYFSSVEDENFTHSEREFQEIILKSLPLLRERWEQGDKEEHHLKGLIMCPGFLGKPGLNGGAYFRCNKDFLECFFRSETGHDPIFEVEHQNRKYHLTAHKKFSPPSRLLGQGNTFTKVISSSNIEGHHVPDYGVMLELMVQEIPGHFASVILLDTCGDVYLPQRNYEFGPSEKTQINLKRFKWDNLNRDIYIDKNLISNREVLEWYDYGAGEKFLKSPPLDLSLLAHPALGLTQENMSQVCRFQGKKPLPAHLFEAATYFPQDLEEPILEKIRNPPFPWSREVRVSLPDPFFSNPTESDCIRVFTKKCLGKFPWIPFRGQSLSWMGIDDVLGGPPESLLNPLTGESMLKASSYLSPLVEDWHFLGQYKKEEDFKEIEADFKGAGFRCYKEVGGEEAP